MEVSNGDYDLVHASVAEEYWEFLLLLLCWNIIIGCCDIWPLIMLVIWLLRVHCRIEIVHVKVASSLCQS